MMRISIAMGVVGWVSGAEKGCSGVEKDCSGAEKDCLRLKRVVLGL